MRRKQQLMFLLLLASTALIEVGCGSNGGAKPTSGGSGDATFATYTLLASGGIWPNAIVDGNVDPTTITCSVFSDPTNCGTGFTNYSTGPVGEFLFSTDALPGTWTVAGRPDANCSYGGSSTETITNDGRIDVRCGTLDGNGDVATPSSCTIAYVNGVQQGYCPPYLEISTPNPVLPTSYALSAGLYSDEGGGEGSYQETASSSTQIRVPAPTNWGLNVITIVDPTTSEVLVATDYILHECIIQTGPYGTQETCPY